MLLTFRAERGPHVNVPPPPPREVVAVGKASGDGIPALEASFTSTSSSSSSSSAAAQLQQPQDLHAWLCALKANPGRLSAHQLDQLNRLGLFGPETAASSDDDLEGLGDRSTASAASTATSITTTSTVTTTSTSSSSSLGEEERPRKKAELLDRQWDDTFERLRKYQTQHGDCLVPRSYPDDRALGHWCGNQRMLHKRGTLRADRLQRLQEIGFVFVADERYLWNGTRNNEHLEDHWQRLYELLVEYRNQMGHVLVPKGYVRHGVPLGRWVCRQRTNLSQGNLRPDRKQKLEQLGFIWKPADVKVKKAAAAARKVAPTTHHVKKVSSSASALARRAIAAAAASKRRGKKSDPLAILADLSSQQTKFPEDDDRRDDDNRYHRRMEVVSSDSSTASSKSASSATTAPPSPASAVRIGASPSPQPEDAAMLEELFLTHV